MNTPIYTFGHAPVTEYNNSENEDEPKLNDESFHQIVLNYEREYDMQQLFQVIRNTQPMADTFATLMMQQLNLLVDGITEINNNNHHHCDEIQEQRHTSSLTNFYYPYPPINQTGPIAEHDRPYAEYHHLDRATIAKVFQFQLESTNSDERPFRLESKMFAITSCTNVSKERVKDKIIQLFGIHNIQYICVGEDINEFNHQRYLLIQIIFKKIVYRRKRFLDLITRTLCNYRVTHHACAWNEYIKKVLNFIEYGTFKSTKSCKQKQWSTVLSSSWLAKLPASTPVVHHQQHMPKAATTTKSDEEERRRYENTIAQQAFKIAETSIDSAIDFIRYSIPMLFLQSSCWYLEILKYIHLRAEMEADLKGNINKEYLWPVSFPDCTHRLREIIHRWIRHQFSRVRHAKCLILIGLPDTGKTSFALSLPGRVNYFQGQWNSDNWSDYARYSVYENIPWDEFYKFNYPNKEQLLTQSGKILATNRWRSTIQINVRQPAIVILKPEEAGSLLTIPATDHERQLADYWRQNACVYIMGPHEYFFKPQH
ncbi:unnamed protein product [Rotaria socialis]|uniref:Replication-associated protein n=1 Tax=Rotaria socialis TaxID=392032 RepID=A0A817Q5L9_9BILA|nr:unnamed protein product [Rotaria socialis]CAF3184400.1 unnamed protein product [Rotaria socialis]CAF4288440.1 unnamed protein product [Rotaria socialis]CAF4428827.1 unnamed protein product [Rotaria socialis]